MLHHQLAHALASERHLDRTTRRTATPGWSRAAAGHDLGGTDVPPPPSVHSIEHGARRLARLIP